MEKSLSVNPLQDLQNIIRLRNLSNSTFRAYTLWFSWFLNALDGVSPGSCSYQNIIDILITFKMSPAWTWSKQNTLINAIKFYFEQCLGREKTMYIIPNAKRPDPVRSFYSKEELNKIFRCCGNLKQRVMLITLYRCGLRISELLNLTVFDIDSAKMLIGISDGKGKHGRYIPLPSDVLTLLREYWKKYRPVYWLFEGPDGRRYTPESVRKFLKKVTRKAGVKEDRTVHSLRHSFATHHIQQGTNLIHLQRLLGHKHSSTTEIYVHTTPLELPILNK